MTICSKKPAWGGLRLGAFKAKLKFRPHHRLQIGLKVIIDIIDFFLLTLCASHGKNIFCQIDHSVGWKGESQNGVYRFRRGVLGSESTFGNKRTKADLN